MNVTSAELPGDFRGKHHRHHNSSFSDSLGNKTVSMKLNESASLESWRSLKNPAMKSLILQSLNSSTSKIRRQSNQEDQFKSGTPSPYYNPKPYGAPSYQSPSYQSNMPSAGQRVNGIRVVIGKDGVKLIMNCYCNIEIKSETPNPAYGGQRMPPYASAPNYALAIPPSYYPPSVIPTAYAPVTPAPYVLGNLASYATATSAPYAPAAIPAPYAPTMAPYAIRNMALDTSQTPTTYSPPYGVVPSSQPKIGNSVYGSEEGEDRNFDCICDKKETGLPSGLAGLPYSH